MKVLNKFAEGRPARNGEVDRVELAQELAELPWVQFAYIFGSQARGEARPDSDLDLAVAVKDAPADAYMQLLRHLRSVADLHLVLIHEAPPLLRYNILRDGKLVYERDAAARVNFQVRSLREYYDWLPGQERLVAAQKARLQARDFGNGRSYDLGAAARRINGLSREAAPLPERGDG